MRYTARQAAATTNPDTIAPSIEDTGTGPRRRSNSAAPKPQPPSMTP